MLKTLKILVIACVTAIVPTSSLAEEVDVTISVSCSEDAQLAKNYLYKNYGETIIFTAVFSDGKHLLHIFANAKTGTWSFVSLNMNGIYCLLYFGDALTPVRPFSREERREKSY